MDHFPKVALIYLSYHSQSYWDDVVASLKKLSYPREKVVLVIVDNPHPIHGLSTAYIEKNILPFSEKELPRIVYLPQQENTGFCGGNNVGLRWAIDEGAHYAFLHNQDGFLAGDALEKMVSAVQNDSTIGCAQTTVLLHPETECINSTGNSYHFLGFGYIPNFGEKFVSKSLKPLSDIGYASGAALLLRVDLLKKYGLLNEDLFAYHEDVEYSLRLKMVGFRVVLIRDAFFFHKYVFSRSPSKFYYIERNRYALLLLYYKWPTLILLLPALILMEFGISYFFWRNGWWKEKISVWKYWAEPDHWKCWLRARHHIQKMRILSDRDLLRSTVSEVSFGEKKTLNSPLLRYVANPFMSVYGFIVKNIIFW